MSLEGINTLKPVVKMQIIGGPPELTSRRLESSLLRFQYIRTIGKNRIPRITLEFDNSSGEIFNLAVFSVGLKLLIRWGYEGLLSRPFIAPIKLVKAAAMPYDDGKPTHRSPKPDAYGTVTMEAHAYDYKLHLKKGQELRYIGPPKRLSDIMRIFANTLGYPDNKVFIQPTNLMSEVDEPGLLMHAAQRNDQTSMQYMKQLAATIGYTFEATDNEFHFHSEQWPAKSIEHIGYFVGPDLLQYSIEGDYSINLQKVTAKAIDILTNSMPTFLFNPETATVEGSVTVLPTDNARNKRMITKDGGYIFSPTTGMPEPIQPDDVVTASTPPRVIEAGRRRLVSQARNKWKIKLRTVGNPNLMPDVALGLYNFGPVIDGMWNIAEVDHTIDGEGYTTSLTAKAKRVAGSRGEIWPTYFVNNEGVITGTYTFVPAGAPLVYKGKKGDTKTPKNKGRNKGATSANPNKITVRKVQGTSRHE